MTWAWATSLDQLWRLPAFPMWLTLAAAGFFGVLLVVTLLRVERSAANATLALLTLLAIGIALATALGGGSGSRSSVASNDGRLMQSAGVPALSCIDDLAGDIVLSACEKALFGSADTVAAAVSYAASQLVRLTALGDLPAAGNINPEMETMRRAIERDRYGLMAHVLVARDHCTPADCAVFRMLRDHQRIVANMEERTFDQMIVRYAPTWNAPIPVPASAPVALLSPSMPTGKPTNAEFPTAASTPAVSIMTPEPASTAAPPISRAAPRSMPAATTPSPPPRPPSTPAPAIAAVKKQAPPKPSRPASQPVQLTPPPPPAAAESD